MSTLLQDATAGLDLRPLPVSADEGFPQSFLLALEERTYLVELHVDVPEHLLPERLSPRDLLDVVGEGADAVAQVVLAVVRQEPDGGLVPLLRRRLLPGSVLTAGELVLVIDSLRIAVGNLNGAGRHGSLIEAMVGAR